MPTVSVIMAVYNGERFIREAIDSVLDEDHCDLELVVLDDGSTDATPRILADYVARDDRIVVQREEGENLAQALNRACRLSRGRLLARLDADDVSIPGRLRAQVNFMDAHPDVVLLGGQALLVNDSGEEFATATYPLRDVDLRERLLSANPFVHSAIMMRRDAFEAVGGYRDDLPHAEDLDLWLRLAEGGKVANLPDAIVKYRIHADQQSFLQQEEQAVHAAATRVSARARAEGKPDPLDGAAQEEIDAPLLVARGVDESEITQVIVESATWLGKTTSRAGYPEAATQLFDAAYDKARSPSGSRELTAYVHRSIGRRHAEQGHRVRANWKFALARLAEWR